MAVQYEINEEESIIIDHFNTDGKMGIKDVQEELEKMNQVLKGLDINQMFGESQELWKNGFMLGYYEAIRRYTKEATQLKEKMDSGELKVSIDGQEA